MSSRITRILRIQKIKIIYGFQVCVLSFLPKNESSEITETLQKFHNPEIWEIILKNNWYQFKFYKTQYNTPTLLIMWQVIVF